MQPTERVNWNVYAQTYDMLLDYNPFYQQLHQQVMKEVYQWNIHCGDILADIGAGTGNYSLAIARYFPQATVLHIDQDEGMNAQAEAKKKQESLLNHQIFSQGVNEVQLQPASLRGLISIHALYTFQNPTSVLRNMYEWLEPGGDAILVNAGRIINVLDWQLAIGWRLIRQYGLRKTLKILRQGKEVSRQNAYIREMQRKGSFWTHSHQEFYQAIESTGFEIINSKTCYREISDFVVARKMD